MAAPCFYAARVLLADLQTLGYTNASDPAVVSPTGQCRLDTLFWLAHVIDPTFEDASEDALAKFWDHLGLQCAERNKAGYRPPLTTAGDKPRDRAAASLYMRTAIDLAMAFQRRRIARNESEQEIGSAGGNGEMEDGDEEEAKEEPLFDSEDIETNIQLEKLIMNRHVFFPGTVKLLGNTQAKRRRPLAPRKPGGQNHISTTKGNARKGAGAAVNKPKNREEMLQRLRILQRETQDLQQKAQAKGSQDMSEDSRSRTESLPEMDEAQVRLLADSSEELTNLVTKFEGISTEALAHRNTRTDLLERDEDADEKISSVAVECEDLEGEVREMLEAAQKLQESVSKLVQGRCMLENLPNSSAVKGVVEYGKRIEKHI